MSTTVCVDGDEFAVNPDGSLSLLICGNRPKAAWPYDCDPATYNPLRVSSECGLWVPPPADAFCVVPSGFENSTNQDINDLGFTNLLVATFDVSNPSACLGAVGIASLEIQVNFSLLPGTNISIRVEWDQGDGGGYTAADTLVKLPNTGAVGDPSSAYSWSYEANRQIQAVTGGETRTCKARVSATSDIPHPAVTTVTDVKINPRVLIVTKS